MSGDDPKKDINNNTKDKIHSYGEGEKKVASGTLFSDNFIIDLDKERFELFLSQKTEGGRYYTAGRKAWVDLKYGQTIAVTDSDGNNYLVDWKTESEDITAIPVGAKVLVAKSRGISHIILDKGQKLEFSYKRSIADSPIKISTDHFAYMAKNGVTIEEAIDAIYNSQIQEKRAAGLTEAQAKAEVGEKPDFNTLGNIVKGASIGISGAALYSGDYIGGVAWERNIVAPAINRSVNIITGGRIPGFGLLTRRGDFFSRAGENYDQHGAAGVAWDFYTNEKIEDLVTNRITNPLTDRFNSTKLGIWKNKTAQAVWSKISHPFNFIGNEVIGPTIDYANVKVINPAVDYVDNSLATKSPEKYYRVYNDWRLSGSTSPASMLYNYTATQTGNAVNWAGNRSFAFVGITPENAGGAATRNLLNSNISIGNIAAAEAAEVSSVSASVTAAKPEVIAATAAENEAAATTRNVINVTRAGKVLPGVLAVGVSAYGIYQAGKSGNGEDMDAALGIGTAATGATVITTISSAGGPVTAAIVTSAVYVGDKTITPIYTTGRGMWNGDEHTTNLGWTKLKAGTSTLAYETTTLPGNFQLTGKFVDGVGGMVTSLGKLSQKYSGVITFKDNDGKTHYQEISPVGGGYITYGTGIGLDYLGQGVSWVGDKFKQGADWLAEKADKYIPSWVPYFGTGTRTDADKYTKNAEWMKTHKDDRNEPIVKHLTPQQEKFFDELAFGNFTNNSQQQKSREELLSEWGSRYQNYQNALKSGDIQNAHKTGSEYVTYLGQIKTLGYIDDGKYQESIKYAEADFQKVQNKNSVPREEQNYGYIYSKDIEKLQQKLGVKDDGKMGPGTVEAMFSAGMEREALAILGLKQQDLGALKEMVEKKDHDGFKKLNNARGFTYNITEKCNEAVHLLSFMENGKVNRMKMFDDMPSISGIYQAPESTLNNLAIRLPREYTTSKG